MRVAAIATLALASYAAVPVADAAVYEHALYNAVSLDGAWEMAYRPYSWETVDAPKFSGVMVEKAVPGYWEDMKDAFRAAGMRDEFRINPLYSRQSFPISEYADDMTLPNILGTFFYRRTVDLRETGPAVLAFEGVRNQVHAWVNGTFVGFHAGFSTPFELNVPDGALRPGTNEIVLAVSNDPNLGYCGAYVCGLTTRAVFGATGGVNGRLELRFLRDCLADVYVTTAADLSEFTVHVSGAAAGFRYEIRGGNRVMAEGRADGDFTLPAKGYDLWSPENPVRYDLTLTTANGTVRRKFGLRRLVADGERLRLNGRPVYLRGVTEHCYFPQTVHLPRDIAYYRMVTARRKELGFNFVRFHTFVPPEEYLEATDELGMLVHVETPNFVAEPEFAAIVAFARRHPSVVIYCMGNEWRIDRLAEVYLRECADIVHERTDALFSPMSAMRGVEYVLVRGKDDISGVPFRHNPKRMARLAEFCDVFTSYQLGLVSYSSLNEGTSADLDAWGDAYCGKPRLSHEICIDGSYADLSTESLYPADSPILKTGMFSGLRRQLEERGLLDRADTYFRNSCEWMRRIRKFTFEKLRAADRVAGFDFLGDINTHWHTFGYSVGMMDEFYRLKPGETVGNVRRYNSAAVLLSDLGSDFNVRAGTRRKVAFSVSNYDRAVANATLRVSLVDADGGGTAWESSSGCRKIEVGRVAPLASFEVEVPATKEPRKYFLRAAVDGLAENEWEIYVFPKFVGGTGSNPALVVDDISRDGLLSAMAEGKRVLLLGAGPFKSLPSTFRIGMAGRCAGDFATVIKNGHPALAGMPHEGFCGWQFRRLMEGGRSVQLEAGVPFDPIIDVASAVKFVIRQSSLFEYRVGEGRLLVCSLRFGRDDPAAEWLRARLEAYAGSDEFDPPVAISPDQLRSVIDAPLLRGTANQNRARNPNDPSSSVRAGELAQP